MKRLTHYCSLTPDSLHQIAEGLQTGIVDDKITYIPENLGKGFIYFTPVTPDISVIYFDVSFYETVKFTRLSAKNDLLIFHYDLSEHVNLLKINNHYYEIGSYNQLDLAIMNNDLESSFKPALNERAIAMRLIINKNILDDFIKTQLLAGIKNNVQENQNQSFYHYGNIDSNSILLIQSVKDKEITDLSFQPFLKGISLKLLGNFFNKLYNLNSTKDEITEIDNEAILKTKIYLENNLYGPFPSVTFLSAMAGMSDSKFKALFKKCFNNTPNNFFIAEKMKLGKKLLKSGNYHTLTEVLYELNYSKLSYFSSKYFELFKRRPSEDFVKKGSKKSP